MCHLYKLFIVANLSGLLFAACKPADGEWPSTSTGGEWITCPGDRASTTGDTGSVAHAAVLGPNLTSSVYVCTNLVLNLDLQKLPLHF